MLAFLRLMVVLVVAFPIALSGAAPARASEGMEVDGVSVAWNSSGFFLPKDCVSYDFNWANGSGEKLLNIQFEILNTDGVPVGFRDNNIPVESGVNGIASIQVCSRDGMRAGAQTLVLRVSHYGGAASEVRGSFNIAERPQAPSPAPAAPPVQSTVPAIAEPTEAPLVVEPPTAVEPIPEVPTEPTVPGAVQVEATSVAAPDPTPFWFVLTGMAALALVVFGARTVLTLADRRRIDRMGRGE